MQDKKNQMDKNLVSNQSACRKTCQNKKKKKMKAGRRADRGSFCASHSGRRTDTS